MHIRQTKVLTMVTVGKPFVIKPQKVQDGRIEIVHVAGDSTMSMPKSSVRP